MVSRDLLHVAAIVIHNDAFRAHEQRTADHSAGRHLERLRLVHFAVNQQPFDGDVVVVTVAIRLRMTHQVHHRRHVQRPRLTVHHHLDLLFTPPHTPTSIRHGMFIIQRVR